MNNELVTRHYKVGDEQIDNGDIQRIITPLWWSVSIYDGETEMYEALERFTEPQRYVWAIQWYCSEVENGGHDQFFCNSTGIVWQLALEGLREIGCQQFEEILHEAAQRLGGSPSFDREERWQEIQRHNAEFDDLDDEFYSSDSALERALSNYIQSNKEAFYFDGEIDIPEQYVDDADDEDEY